MEYNYTKPRMPISAMYSSPGPCYALPTLVGYEGHDPRSVHYRAPAYGFGIKHAVFDDSASPGPKYYPDSKMYNNGKDGSPHWSLAMRLDDLKPFLTPSPFAYRPENAKRQVWHNYPEYSFGTRHRNVRSDNNPAPNAYTLNHMMGHTIQSGKPQAPMYSLAQRLYQGSFLQDLAKAPGPGTYNATEPCVYKYCPPIYSLTSKHFPPEDNTLKPGPGAHDNDKVWLHKTQAPRFSFGIRHSPFTTPLITEIEDDGTTC